MQFLLGTAAGILFGLVPGLHPNLAVPFLFSSSTPFLASFMATNMMFDAVPSVIVGVPEEGKEISSFQSKRYYSHGLGYYGILKTAWSTYLGFLLSIPLSLLFILLYPLLPRFNPALVLLPIAAMNILPELPNSLLLFSFSGFLGLLGMKFVKSSLTPLLSGLFGVPNLVLSMLFPSKAAKQTKEFPIERRSGLTRGVLLGMLSCLVPALSPSQLAIISPSDYITFSSSLSASNSIMSVASSLFGSPRSGVGVAFMESLSHPILHDFVEFLLISGMSASLSMLLLTTFSWHIIRISEKIDQRILSGLSLLIISAIVFKVSGLPGLLLLAASSCLGVYAFLSKERKTHLLGSIIYPAILIHLGII